MRRSMRKGSSAVAFLAALILCVQTFLSAWAGAAMADQPTLDAFGNPLCITSADHGNGSTDHSTMPACCTLGCSAAVSVLPVPAFDDAAIARPLLASIIAVGIGEGVVLASPDHDPGSPRAPPLTA